MLCVHEQMGNLVGPRPPNCMLESLGIVAGTGCCGVVCCSSGFGLTVGLSSLHLHLSRFFLHPTCCLTSWPSRWQAPGWFVQLLGRAKQLRRAWLQVCLLGQKSGLLRGSERGGEGSGAKLAHVTLCAVKQYSCSIQRASGFSFAIRLLRRPLYRKTCQRMLIQRRDRSGLCPLFVANLTPCIRHEADAKKQGSCSDRFTGLTG